MMVGVSSVMGVHCMRQSRNNDEVLILQVRQKEKFWWYGFGVVLFR
jgi:hypothetical protein